MAEPKFTQGQQVIWTGMAGKFARTVRITEVRMSYLVILGETPEDARPVYDIADPFIKATVLSIPEDQLSDPDQLRDQLTARTLPAQRVADALAAAEPGYFCQDPAHRTCGCPKALPF